MNTTDTPTTVEIPADVRDNSETVTDYVYMAWRRPNKGVVTPQQRDAAIMWSDGHGYVRYQEYDTNPDGQRCRFDILLNVAGEMIHLFHTEYFTRVACCTHDAHYATHYASVTDQDGVTTIPAAYCGECMIQIRRSARDSGMTVNTSERLRIGQHD